MGSLQGYLPAKVVGILASNHDHELGSPLYYLLSSAEGFADNHKRLSMHDIPLPKHAEDSHGKSLLFMQCPCRW